MEKAAGATASKEAYPVGRRESVKHWFFKGRQRPPANPPDTGQSRSDCPPLVALPKVSSQPEKDSFFPHPATRSKKATSPGCVHAPHGDVAKCGFKGPAPFAARPWAMALHPKAFPAREKPQADSFSAAAGVFLPDPVDSISAKRSSSSRMRRSISAICCTMVRFFSLSRETMQVR